VFESQHDIMTKNKAQTSQPTDLAVREENPAWLVEEPTGPRPTPPVTPLMPTLNFLGLGWPDFERLCRRLASRSGDVVASWAYGSQGHAQLGIDILVRKKDGTFEAWQSKRYQSFGPVDVREAIKVFLEADWAKEAKRLAVLRRIGRDTAAADAIIEAIPLAPSHSARISLLALLGKGTADNAKVRPFLEQALADDANADVPGFGFDMTTEKNRLVRHVLRELLSW
jgi:hypothetical protein